MTEFLTYLKNNSAGAVCPCCNRFAKIYKRKLTSTTCASLIALYKLGGAKQYIHASKLVLRGLASCDIGKAKYFGLIEQAPKDIKDRVRKTSGYWRLTEAGFAFIAKQSKVPKYALIYDDEVLGYDFSEQFTIEDCLKKAHFSYSELMDF